MYLYLLYCRVPARWGLQQTTLAPGSDETRARDEKHGPTIGPVLLRLGEPGTSQYVSLYSFPENASEENITLYDMTDITLRSASVDPPFKKSTDHGLKSQIRINNSIAHI